MQQKLSAWNYIKNNKRRIAVLIVSLCLCFMMTYLVQFLLSSTEETFRPILLENTKKTQYISLSESSLGIDADKLDDVERQLAYEEKNHQLAERLKEQKGIKEAFYSQVIYNEIAPAVGTITSEIPCVEPENLPVIMEHVNATLIDGRLPEKPGEIVLDEASMLNGDYNLNGYFREDYYEEDFKIVGVLECETYFGCGLSVEKNDYNSFITILSDGSIEDMSVLLENMGIGVRDNHDVIIDFKWGEMFLEEEIIEAMGNSTKFIYVGILIILSLSLFIVYTMYLRDRHNEWCLYSSIGYSRKSIYFSIIKELLFAFAIALIIGGVLISIFVIILDYVMIKPLGLRCRYFQPNTIAEILCSYVLLFGILQIPIRYALYKIRTVDAIEDDLQ